MAYLAHHEEGAASGVLRTLQESLGFVPNLFRAQTLLPAVVEVEAGIARAALFDPGALSRISKEMILLAVAAGHRNTYCVAAHRRLLLDLGVPPARVAALARDYREAGLERQEEALLDFTLRLAFRPTHVGPADIAALRQSGLEDDAILEAIVVTGLTRFLCTLATGLGVDPDFEAPPFPAGRPPLPSRPAAGAGVAHDSAGPDGPYLKTVDLPPDSFPPFAVFRNAFGFVPNIFRAQTLRPDIVAAEARAVETILLDEQVLPRALKEYILLVVSAANLNTYCVAVHCEMLRNLGIPLERSDRIAINHRDAGLDAPTAALLDFALALDRRPDRFGAADIASLRDAGFDDRRILEAVVMVALTRFLNTLQVGLGPTPDIHPHRVFPRQEAELTGDVNPAAAPAPLMEGGGAPGVVDPDADLVARARGGDLGAFEDLVRRHARCVYRTVSGITGRKEDAEDAMQTAFMKAFQRLGEFRGTARFSTWLVRIAINEALEKVRARRPVAFPEREQPDGEEADQFRPRRLEAWADDPERLYARRQTRILVEQAILALPEKYRVAVMLRDMEQLSTEEAAAATGLPVATLKTHLLRGRLMLREALAPHFAAGRRGN